MRIIEVNLEDVDLTEEKIQVNFSEVKIYMVDQNPYQGQYQNNSYQGNNYEDNRSLYHNPHRNFQQGNNYGQFRGRIIVVAEVITMDAVTVSPIIEVIITTNTISIMVMMMSTRQINMACHVHYAVVITTPLNIVLRENTISKILWKR